MNCELINYDAMSSWASKLILSLAVAGVVTAQTDQSALKEMISQYAQTVRETQKKKQSFEEDKQVLEASKESIEAEIVELEKRIEELKASQESSGVLSQKTLEEKEVLEAAREAFGGQVEILESKVKDVIAVLPASLVNLNDNLKGAIEAFEEHQKAGSLSKVGLNKRLQNALTIIGEAENFNRRVTKVSEVYQVSEGVEQGVTMVYFGLSAGFGASKDGALVLAATPTPEGWVYEEKADLAKEILELVQIAEGDSQAGFVNLPISVK